MRDALPRSSGGIGLAPHAPFTASTALYRDAAGVAVKHDLPLTTHLAESREEMEMFRDARGALFDFMQSIGRPMDDYGRATPLAHMSREGLLDGRWIVAHLNELSDRDYELLSSAPKFHIVHCPRSHQYFGHAAFPYQRLRQLRFNISLGTDSLATNDDLSLFREMRQLSRMEPSLSPRELVEMVTIAPAKALRQETSLGRLRRGFKADLIAVACAADANEVFEEVVECDAEVPWSMVNGAKIRGG
jgi:cytosine/adenosine deaminase-related metal-dependent hydrolase